MKHRLTLHYWFVCVILLFSLAATPKAFGDINAGLLAHWTFDERFGPTAKDNSPSGNTATLINGPAWIDGKIGGALLFNGINQYILTPAAGPTGTGGVSASLWIKTSTEGKVLLAFGEDAGVHPYFRVMVGSNEIYMRTGTGQIGFSAPNIANGQWHHVVVVVPPGATLTNTLFYLDGIQLRSKTRDSNPFQVWNIGAGDPITIGANSAVNGFVDSFLGAIDDVRIYNRALTPAEAWEIHDPTPISTSPPVVSGAAGAYYVASNGNDSNPGTLQAPFLTIQEAQRAVRSFNSNMQSDIVVFLRQGTYELSETIGFDGRDSGSNGHNVIYASYPGEKATISGGRRVSGWTPIGNGIYRADVPGMDFRQLYVNGSPAIRARTPNLGSFNRVVSWDLENRKIVVNFADIRQWSGFEEVEFVTNLEWTHLRLHLASFADGPTGRVITPRQADLAFAGWTTHKRNSQSYFFENSFDFLDAPGEWHLDRRRGQVYYIPRAGEQMETATATVPVIERLVQLQGDLGFPVQNIQFHGITFENSNWTAPSNHGFFSNFGDNRVLGIGDNTGNSAIPAALRIWNATNVRFERNTFRNMGGVAVMLYAGVTSSSFEGNVFQDVAASALAVDSAFSDRSTHLALAQDLRSLIREVTIRNNYFTRVASDYTSSLGIFAVYVQGLLIEHNEFYDLPYSAISIGTAGSATAAETQLRNNIIRFNRIHNVVNRMSDGGGIYTMSNQPGTQIFENYLYNIFRSPYAGFYPVAGIYLDNKTGNVRAENNVIESMDRNLELANFINSESFNNLVINPFGAVVDLGTNTRIVRDGNINPEAIKAKSGIEPAYQNILR